MDGGFPIRIGFGPHQRLCSRVPGRSYRGLARRCAHPPRRRAAACRHDRQSYAAHVHSRTCPLRLMVCGNRRRRPHNRYSGLERWFPTHKNTHARSQTLTQQWSKFSIRNGHLDLIQFAAVPQISFSSSFPFSQYGVNKKYLILPHAYSLQQLLLRNYLYIL